MQRTNAYILRIFLSLSLVSVVVSLGIYQQQTKSPAHVTSTAMSLPSLDTLLARHVPVKTIPTPELRVQAGDMRALKQRIVQSTRALRTESRIASPAPEKWVEIGHGTQPGEPLVDSPAVAVAQKHVQRGRIVKEQRPYQPEVHANFAYARGSDLIFSHAAGRQNAWQLRIPADKPDTKALTRQMQHALGFGLARAGSCWQRAALAHQGARNPAMSMRVVFNARGMAEKVIRLQDSLADAELNKCIDAALMRVRLAAMPGERVFVDVPLSFAFPRDA